MLYSIHNPNVFFLENKMKIKKCNSLIGDGSVGNCGTHSFGGRFYGLFWTRWRYKIYYSDKIWIYRDADMISWFYHGGAHEQSFLLNIKTPTLNGKLFVMNRKTKRKTLLQDWLHIVWNWSQNESYPKSIRSMNTFANLCQSKSGPKYDCIQNESYKYEKLPIKQLYHKDEI